MGNDPSVQFRSFPGHRRTSGAPFGAFGVFGVWVQRLRESDPAMCRSLSVRLRREFCLAAIPLIYVGNSDDHFRHHIGYCGHQPGDANLPPVSA